MEELDEVEGYFGEKIAPGSFSWVVPVNETIAKIGLLTRNNAGAMSCLSKYHFSRLFKKLTGLAPVHFAASVSIEQAQTLLGTTDLSVKEVAGAVGFRDVGAFSRKFKQCVGMAPASYKARLRERVLAVAAAASENEF